MLNAILNNALNNQCACFLFQCQITGSTSLMIRKPTLEVLQHLKGLSEGASPPRKFIFCIL